MIRLFKTGYIFHAVGIIIIAIFIWLPSFLSQQTLVVESTATPLCDLYLHIIGSNYLVNLISSSVLVILSGMVINQIIIANEFSGKITMLGMFFFVLLVTSMDSYLFMNPFLWASFFLMLMLNELFKLPKGERPIPIVFNASFYLGMASLFYYPTFLLLIVIWVSLMIFRVSSWREYVIALIGSLLPLFFAFTWYYFNDTQDSFFSTIKSAFQFDFRIMHKSVMEIVIAVLLLGIILPSILKLAGGIMEKSIVLRQKLTVTIWLFVVSFIIIFFFEKHPSNGLLLSIPTTIILTNFSFGISRKKLKWLDLYVSLIFILVIINHYLVLFDA